MAAPPTPWRSIAPQVPCIRATMSELNDHGYAARMFSALQKQKFGNNMVKMAKVEDDRERLNAEKNSDTSGTNNRVKPEIHGISDRMFQALQSQQYGDSEVALVKMEIERDQLAKELLSREDDVKTLQHQNEELKAHLQAAEIGARNARIYEVELADKNIKIESLEKEVTAEKDANKHLRLSNTELQLANDASIQRITGLETALIIRRKKLTRARDLLKVQRANNADLRTHPSARRHLFSRSEEQQRSRRSRTVDSLMHITFGVQRPRERSPQVTDSSATSTQHVRRSDRADGSDSRDGFQANNATPRSRKQALEKYPQIVVDLNSSHLHESVVFNRTFLSRQLGGNPRRVDVTVKSQTPLSTEFHINKYACPNARDNPWCPTEPGSHGYMFMGLGTDHDVYQTADELHLFVGVNMACYRYMGLYRMQTTAPLTKEEWATLSEKTQKSYSRITETRVFKEVCSEASDPDRVEQIQREYDSGHLLVPCVELVCVDFDYELYERLACIKTTASQAETLSDASHEGDSSYGSKRRRDDEALPSTARKSARLSDGRTRAPSRFLTES
ncbi:hypothetical protein PLICRDRAFT_49566 [Plicaturopsis crispa FD-325 SS-3]|nr:hypothetical protein PLICRDRAFT_49566 [Plicaturopsis crispa FD-325 SS-3]